MPSWPWPWFWYLFLQLGNTLMDIVSVRVAACILDQRSVGTVLSSGFAFADIDTDAPQLLTCILSKIVAYSIVQTRVLV